MKEEMTAPALDETHHAECPHVRLDALNMASARPRCREPRGESFSVKRILLFALPLLAGVLLGANESVEFRTAPLVLVNGSTTTAICPSVDGLPAGFTPAFHFDASERTGWQYCGDGSVVWKIPSLVGSRYLTTNTTELSSWPNGWGYSRFPKGAVLVQNEEQIGVRGPYLDFGEYGSQRGLFFNPDPDNLDDSSRPLNDIVGIGTVFAVMDSSGGGGYLLGGGWKWSGNGSTMNVSGTVFSRDGGNVSAHSYAAPLTPYLYSSLGQQAAWRQDGLWVKVPTLGGYSGGWEVASVVASKTDIPATGVGIGKAAIDISASGGQKIAELLIYTNKLSDAVCADVAAYLRRKWFGDSVPGHDGRAEAGVFRVSHSHGDGTSPRTGGGVSATVSVPANATLAIDRVSGGRRGGKLTISGGGMLSVRAAETYGGSVSLSGASLEIPARVVPTALPSGAVMHLDASDATTLTTEEVDGVTRVSGWSSTGGAAYSVVALDDASRPVLRDDQFANGKPCVDFGAFGSGCMMKVLNSSGNASQVKIVQSILYVADMQNGGGTIFGSVGSSWTAAYANFIDRGSNTNSFDKGIFYTISTINQLSSKASPYSGIIYLNGERANGNKGFAAPAWQTFAANVPGGSIYTIGGTYWPSYPARGGMRIAELVVYDRMLMTRELEDASAYLANKWFGTPTAGYVGAVAEGVATVDSVATASDATVSVPGEAVRVRSLSSAAQVTKTGAGRLDVQTAAVTSLVVSAGTVRAVPEPDVESVAMLAPGASLRLDATDTNHMGIASNGGRDYVFVWRDADNPRRAAYIDNASCRPWINNVDTCNGHPVVDFGAYGTAGADSGRYMRFATPLDNVRSVFMVVRIDPNGFAPLLGYSTKDPISTSSYNAPMDFTRHQKSSDTAKGMFLANGYSALANAEVLTNGVSGLATSFVPCGDYMLVEAHPKTGAYASGLCYESGADIDEPSKMLGGMRIGELVVYERVLSAREKVATRNYLMRKWFGVPDGELAALPERVAPAFSVGEVSVEGDGCFETAPGTQLDGDLSYASAAEVRLVVSAGPNGEPCMDCVTVNGTLSFGSGMTVSLDAGSFSPDALDGHRFAIFRAGSFANAGQFAALRLAPPFSSRARFVVKSDRIEIVFGKPGVLIMIK